MNQTTDNPYLTVAEVAEALGMTTDGVYKLIRRDKLPALRLSERGIRVTRWALEAYRDSLNGGGPDTSLPAGRIDLEDVSAAFEDETGMSPEEWVAAWKRDDVEDSAENNALLVQALALREQSAGAPEDWIRSALTRRAVSARRWQADREVADPELRTINRYLQQRLRELNRHEVPAVEAADWLDTAGLLGDSDTRPGRELRRLLRQGLIEGAGQRPAHRYGRWYITRA
jgi:excisionase family DNA binding protein